MRCKNCGWPNKPGAVNCTKCNSPLSEEGGSSLSNATVLNPGNPAPPTPTPAPAAPGLGESPMGGTVFEGDVFGGAPAAPAAPTRPTPPPVPGNPRPAPGKPTAGSAAPGASQAVPKQKVCPKCGYPLRPDSDKCPNCKFQIASRPAAADEPRRPAAPAAPGLNRRPTVVGNQAGFEPAPNRAMRGTVNPYLQGHKPHFTLTPKQRDTERVAPEAQSFEGDTVTLNRANTEPENYSITSREQAIIYREGDKWFIEDHSDQKTTFVQAGRKTEIRPGDTILLGNRVFTFGED